MGLAEKRNRQNKDGKTANTALIVRATEWTHSKILNKKFKIFIAEKAGNLGGDPVLPFISANYLMCLNVCVIIDEKFLICNYFR